MMRKPLLLWFLLCEVMMQKAFFCAVMITSNKSLLCGDEQGTTCCRKTVFQLFFQSVPLLKSLTHLHFLHLSISCTYQYSTSKKYKAVDIAPNVINSCGRFLSLFSMLKASIFFLIERTKVAKMINETKDASTMSNSSI